jgi:hypothetical protein
MSSTTMIPVDQYFWIQIQSSLIRAQSDASVFSLPLFPVVPYSSRGIWARAIVLGTIRTALPMALRVAASWHPPRDYCVPVLRDVASVCEDVDTVEAAEHATAKAEHETALLGFESLFTAAQWARDALVSLTAGETATAAHLAGRAAHCAAFSFSASGHATDILLAVATVACLAYE